MEDTNTGLGTMTGKQLWNFIGANILVYICVFCLMTYPALVLCVATGGVANDDGSFGMGIFVWFVTVCFIGWCFFNIVNTYQKRWKTMLIALYLVTLHPFCQYVYWVYNPVFTGHDADGKNTIAPFEGIRWFAPFEVFKIFKDDGKRLTCISVGISVLLIFWLFRKKK